MAHPSPLRRRRPRCAPRRQPRPEHWQRHQQPDRQVLPRLRRGQRLRRRPRRPRHRQPTPVEPVNHTLAALSGLQSLLARRPAHPTNGMASADVQLRHQLRPAAFSNSERTLDRLGGVQASRRQATPNGAPFPAAPRRAEIHLGARACRTKRDAPQTPRGWFNAPGMGHRRPRRVPAHRRG